MQCHAGRLETAAVLAGINCYMNVDGDANVSSCTGTTEKSKRTLQEDLTELKITVVTQYEEIAKTAQAQEIQVLFNPHPELGISSSIKIGLNANTDADAQLFTVSDQPWLSWRTICELIREFQNSEKGIACVSYQGKMGNPCIFRKKYYEELSKLEGDRGGKKVIMKHPEDTQIIEVSDERELEDIDYKL